MFSVEVLNGDSPKFSEEWDDGREYVTAHTSGSTGIPKEIRLNKTDMIQSARSTVDFFNLNENSVLYCPLSTDYIAGKMMWVRARVADCMLLIEKPANNIFNLPSLALPRRIDLIAIVPSQIPSLIEKSRDIEIENVIIGGAPISENEEQSLLAQGVNAYATFGMTETCSHVALRKIGEERYYPLPGIKFCVDEDCRLIINMTDRSVSRLSTNDVVELHSDGSFTWKGRADNVINSGAIKIHPEEIEGLLKDIVHSPFAVTSMADPKWGEIPVLVVEGGPLITVEEIKCYLAVKVDRRKSPKKIFRVGKLPLTGNGKIDRPALRRLMLGF